MFYNNVDAAEGTVFTFRLGIDGCLALCIGKSIYEVVLFLFH